MASDGPKRRVLVVEDDHDTRNLLAMGLKRAGYDVSTAENGQVAMTKLETDTPDVLLLDLMMPQVDGVRLLRWVREVRKLTLPALIFSSSDLPELVAEVTALGPTTFLVKPVRLPTLLETLEKIIT